LRPPFAPSSSLDRCDALGSARDQRRHPPRRSPLLSAGWRGLSAEADRARGRPLLPNEVPLCTHCRGCSGTPTEDDLHPETWDTTP